MRYVIEQLFDWFGANAEEMVHPSSVLALLVREQVYLTSAQREALERLVVRLLERAEAEERVEFAAAAKGIDVASDRRSTFVRELLALEEGETDSDTREALVELSDTVAGDKGPARTLVEKRRKARARRDSGDE